MHAGYWWGNQKELYHYEDLDLKRNRKVGTEWIHLAQDRDQWWALVNMVTNHLVP
jgi:hypothetical protein